MISLCISSVFWVLFECIFSACVFCDCGQIVRVFKAKVPILKVTDPFSKAEADISVATFYTNPTTVLLRRFTCFDDRRVKPFLVFIKLSAVQFMGFVCYFTVLFIWYFIESSKWCSCFRLVFGLKMLKTRGLF